MLRHSWLIDLILETNDAVVVEALSLLDGLLDQVLALLDAIDLITAS